MDYPRRILFQRKPPRWWSFLAKSGVDLVLIGRDFVVNQSMFILALFAVFARCGMSWLPTTCFQMGDLMLAAPV
jgi:hypothetical protein